MCKRDDSSVARGILDGLIMAAVFWSALCAMASAQPAPDPNNYLAREREYLGTARRYEDAATVARQAAWEMRRLYQSEVEAANRARALQQQPTPAHKVGR